MLMNQHLLQKNASKNPHYLKTRVKVLHLEGIFEDAERINRVLKKGRINCEILVVNNKCTFLEALSYFAPDIILTDHVTPNFKSTQVIETAKMRGINVPIILVTSELCDEKAIEILNQGAADYLFKDRLNRLPYAVQNAIDKNRLKLQLCETEKSNLDVLSSLSSHIALVSFDGTLVAVNKAWEEYDVNNGTKCFERLSVGSNYFDVCKEAITYGDCVTAEALAGIKSILKSKKPYFEMEYASHSTEQEQWFLFSARTYGSNTNKVVISHQNITERKIAENELINTTVELQQTLAKFTKILDSSLDVICTINREGEFVNVSAASQKAWGYKSKDLVGSKFMGFVHPQDIEITNKATEKIIKGRKIPIFENRFIHKNGRIVPLLWSVNWDEKLGLLCCIAKDITEKISLERAIENERDQFYDVLLKAPSAIGVIKGKNHVFDMANPLYLQLIGKNDIIGKSVIEVLPEVIEQGFVAMLDKVYQTGEPYIGKEALVKIDKNNNGELVEMYMDFVFQAFKNGKGETEGVSFFINDITEQVFSNKKIKKSEKQYRQIVETAQEGIWLLDENQRIIFVNKKMCEILEYTEEEILCKEHLYFMDECEKKKALKAIKRRKRGIAESYELAFKSKTGKHILTSISANPIFDDSSKYKGSLGMVSDITEKKIAEGNNRFKANLLNTIGQAAIATDLDGVVTYWNKAAENAYGWTHEEAVGTNIMHLTTSNSTKQQATEIMKDLKNGHTWSGEFEVQRKDGSYFPASVANSPIYNENNELSGIIGISSDITEKKKLEALLDKSNRLARIGSWEIDVKSGSVFWSDITKEIREADPDFIPDLKTGIGFFAKDNDKEVISNRLQECIDSGIPWDEELEIMTFKGNMKWVRTIGEAEFFNGECIKVYGSFQDITERKKAEIERVKMVSDIIQRNSDLEQFSYIVSHNLRAPTANIIGFAGILLNENLTPEEQRESLMGLSSSVAVLDDVIKDINTILQIQKEVHEKKETIVFSKLVDDIMISIQKLVIKPRARIVCDFSEVDKIYSLKIYIYSIFYNLIINSIKYGKPNKPPIIDIKSRNENGKIILTFKDNGLGIDIDAIGTKIFGLYNRFHSHVEGKGMGLFMVKAQVELLGGTIAVSSELNKGTEFTIIFDN